MKFTYLPTGDPKDIAIKLMVGSHSDLATLNAALEGIFAHGEAGFGYTLGGLPGRHKFGATYGWNRTYEDLERKFPHLLPGTLDPDKPGTWSVDYNWWQYVDTYAGARRKGWGPFFRFGASDGNPNPYQLSLSGGIGGEAPWRCEDGFGVGGFWTKVSDASATRPLDDEYGVEAFYRIGVTPWLHVTFDIQAVHSALREAETSILFGIRTRWRF